MTWDDMLALADNIRPDLPAMCFRGQHQTLQTLRRFRHYPDSMVPDSIVPDSMVPDFPGIGFLDRYHFRLGSRAIASGHHFHLVPFDLDLASEDLRPNCFQGHSLLDSDLSALSLPIGFHPRPPAVAVAPIDRTGH